MSTSTSPPALAHLVIFNPSLGPSQSPPYTVSAAATAQEQDAPEPAERDRDIEDDLRQAAQIAFYTCRSSTSVSRDTMLKQTGLVKGLCGFADMVARDPSASFTSISSSNARLLVWSPEPDWYIYVNVSLATTTTEDGKVEPSTTAQGISDYTLVNALARGYEDFRLLHGPLSSLLPLSPSSSSLLDKYWTRFALNFEDTYISPSPSIVSAIGATSAPSQHTAQAVARVVEVFRQDTDLDPEFNVGIVNGDGSLYSSVEDPALSRYLSSLVTPNLPPAPATPLLDTRQSLGFGLQSSRPDRKTSWNIASLGSMGGLGFGSFLPALHSRTVSTSRSASPSIASLPLEPGASGKPPVRPSPPDAREGRPAKSRWSFGVPTLGITDAMGSVGGVFGLGTVAKVTEPEGTTAEETVNGAKAAEATVAAPAAEADQPDSEEHTIPETEQGTEATLESDKDLPVEEEHAAGDDLASQVSQSVFDPSDLRDAIEPEDEILSGWEHRSLWISHGKEPVPRRLTYIIRDNVLLYIVQPPDTPEEASYPQSQAALSLYSKLLSILGPMCPSSPDTSKSAGTNSTLLLQDGMVEQLGPALEPAPSASLAELRDVFQSGIHEVYARTHASRFVLAQRLRSIPPFSKKDWAEEPAGDAVLYMLVGQKDASLTDAEHAVRGFLRGKPLAIV